MKLLCNKLFNLEDLKDLQLDLFYINKEICLLILSEGGFETDQFYILYDSNIISKIKQILLDNSYEQNQFYFLLNY